MSPRPPDSPILFEHPKLGRFGPEPADWSPAVPVGIFLDSSIVIYLQDYGTQIWENETLPTYLSAQQRRQIDALRTIMALAERASLAFCVSAEVARETGGQYVRDIAAHWQEAR